jgi:hypothetical protein
LVETKSEGHESLAGRPILERQRTNRKAGELRNGCIDLLLEAVDAAEADTFRVLIVQHFEGIAVEDGDDMTREIGGVSRGRP